MYDVNGKNVVVTGAIAGESRATAERKLRERGAVVQKAVTGATDVVVTGERVGAVKIAKARENGAEVVPWHVVVDEAAIAAAPAPDVEQVAPRRAVIVSPMLAKKADEIPTAGEWLYEIKWDGHRCVAHVGGGSVFLQSRQGKTTTEKYPGVVAALAGCEHEVVLDGEVVVFDEQGASSFAKLINANGHGVVFVAFDLLELDGTDLRGYSFDNRRELLEAVVAKIDDRRVQLSPTFDDGDALLEVAAERRLEGIVAKPRASRYCEGKRGPWLKIKLREEQEFVVLGYTEGQGARSGTAGAFLVGVYDEDRLVYAGKVGAGGTYDDFARIVEQTKPVREYDVDVGDAPRREFRDVTWVVPELVLQVRYQRVTEDGRLWHPSIVGQRDDKDPREVVWERVAA